MPISIGLVYLWFGSLKFFSGVSPAEQLAKNTITHLTAGLILPELSILLLAIWETGIGVLLIFNLWNRMALHLALVHILFTFSPFIFFSDLMWTDATPGLTLLGQYIVKNIIILCMLVVLLWKK
ncbi:MAG: doxx family protein [Flavobacteriaceae bacterium]